MTVKQLRAFLAVARTRNFAQASELVHLSQPALSLAIKKLEESLGGHLLTRTTRSVALTPEGEALCEQGERLLADWDNLEEELHQRFTLQRGKVAIAAMPSFAASLLPSCLLAYRDHYAGINVEIHDVVAERVVDMVREHRIEVGITFDPGSSEELRFQPLFEDEFIAVLPPGHPFHRDRAITWTELLRSEFITLQRPSRMRSLIEHRLLERGLQLSVALEAHQLVTVGRMVAAGLGVGAVPMLCKQQMEQMGACCVELVEPRVSRRVGVVTRRRDRLSTAAQAFVDVMNKQFEGQCG